MEFFNLNKTEILMKNFMMLLNYILNYKNSVDFYLFNQKSVEIYKLWT
jgi:hypothetical protein